MSPINDNVSEILLDKVADWLMRTSLSDETLETIVRGFCERLAAAGLPLMRVHLSFSMLHPLYDALGFTWWRGQGVEVSGLRHEELALNPERFLHSPYYYLLSNNLDHVRRRIDPALPSEFPIFDELKEQGATDYIAFMQPLGAESEHGMVGSWTTDRQGGFNDDVIAALLRLQNHLAIAAKVAVLGKLADNMLTTYLGANAGRRVMSGQVRRGDGETVRAVLVMADMRQSTMLAEKEGRQAYIESLNGFFDAIATPFNRNGGQILSFIGDGFIGVYPCGRHKEPSEMASREAFAAVGVATARMAALNAERKRQGRDPIGYGIAPACRKRHVRQCRPTRPADLLGVRLRGERGSAAAEPDEEICPQRRRERGLRELLWRGMANARAGETARGSPEVHGPLPAGSRPCCNCAGAGI